MPIIKHFSRRKFQSCKKSQEKLLQKQAFQLYPQGSWEDLPIQRQYTLLHELFIERAAQIFSLVPASWNPLQLIETLICLMQMPGPVIAGGLLGKGGVSVAPIYVKSDDHYQYEGWKPGTYVAKSAHKGHFVVILWCRRLDSTPQCEAVEAGRLVSASFE